MTRINDSCVELLNLEVSASLPERPSANNMATRMPTLPGLLESGLAQRRKSPADPL